MSKGKKSVRKHKRKTGRTGSIQKKKNPTKLVVAFVILPNAPFCGWGTR